MLKTVAKNGRMPFKIPEMGPSFFVNLDKFNFLQKLKCELRQF